VGKITIELPLSAHVTMASLSLIFLQILFTVFASGCISCSGFCLWSVSIRFATIFLYMSLSLVGSFVIAVSASSARVWIQFLFFACILYFSPFWRSLISLSEKGMSVLFITLGLKRVLCPGCYFLCACQVI